MPIFSSIKTCGFYVASWQTGLAAGDIPQHPVNRTLLGIMHDLVMKAVH